MDTLQLLRNDPVAFTERFLKISMPTVKALHSIPFEDLKKVVESDERLKLFAEYIEKEIKGESNHLFYASQIRYGKSMTAVYVIRKLAGVITTYDFDGYVKLNSMFTPSMLDNELWIDMMKHGNRVYKQLEKAFGITIPPTLPDGILKINFYTGQDKSCWIECQGKRLDFTITIEKKRRKPFQPESKYKLFFKVIKNELDMFYMVEFNEMPKNSCRKFAKILIGEMIKN